MCVAQVAELESAHAALQMQVAASGENESALQAAQEAQAAREAEMRNQIQEASQQLAAMQESVEATRVVP